MIGAGLVRNFVGQINAIQAAVLALLAASSGSSLVGFLQAGAGALARTLQERMRDRISVFDFMSDAQRADVRAGTLTLDVAAAIQAAIDEAQARTGASTSAPVVFFPAGGYRVDTVLDWKSAALLGENSPGVGVRLVWGGAAGGTLMRKWATAHPGGLSFGLMENINLRGDGANKPAVLLDLSTVAGAVDAMFHLRRVHFTTASDVLLKLAGWVNLHWRDLRFDGGDNYAIQATPPAGTALSSFRIEGFTYDNGGTGKGFLRVDNSAGSANLGVIALKGARVELNGAWTGEKAFISYAAAGTVRSALFCVEDMGFADGGSAGNSLLYRDSGVAGGEILAAQNIQFNLAANWAIVGGNINAAVYAQPPTRNYAGLLATTSAQSNGSVTSDLGWVTPASSSVYPAYVRRSDEANNRWQLRSDGRIEWGGGAGATDVALERSAADTLRLATGDKLIPQTTGQELGGSANQWRVYHEVVATASLPAAAGAMNGVVLIEDNGAGDRNLILYAGSQRFRIDGGAAF